MKKINIVHLYPDLLNLYGDKGNISALEKRLVWRDIDAEITDVNRDDDFDVSSADIIFLGGGSDREQEVVVEALSTKREEFRDYIEKGGVFIALCGGYPIIGKSYVSGNKTAEGLGLLDFYTEPANGRLIGNIVLESDLTKQKIIGFENHPGRTIIGDYKPLGKVLAGNGNTGDSGYEGLVYKNLIATYLHGPLLPKNQMLCDYILTQALKNKYDDFKSLEPINDELENTANEFMEKRLLSK